MPKFWRPLAIALLFVGLFAARSTNAQPKPQAAPGASETTGAKVGVTTVVTVLGPNFTAPPTLGKEDVIVHTGKRREDVIRWTAAQGENDALDLAILIDDLDNTSIANQFSDVRAFITDQAKDTRIGVYYADNGAARPGIAFTPDHDAAAKGLRLPLGFGAASVSIYQSLMDLISKWPAATGVRREVLVIGDGIDRFRGDPNSTDVTLTIERAQKAGIIIHTLYACAATASDGTCFGLGTTAFSISGRCRMKPAANSSRKDSTNHFPSRPISRNWTWCCTTSICSSLQPRAASRKKASCAASMSRPKSTTRKSRTPAPS